MTPPEVMAWVRLRQSPHGCLKFRRQHPLGAFVFDFYCAAARLVVEVDGASHDMGDRPERDALRDAWAAARGLTVLRIPAGEVLADADAAADAVQRMALELVPLWFRRARRIRKLR